MVGISALHYGLKLPNFDCEVEGLIDLFEEKIEDIPKLK